MSKSKVDPGAASPITEAEQLRQHLKDQLLRNEYSEHTFLWSTSGSGHTQPVKIRPKSHGYVLFAKFFQPEDISKMRREAMMYQRLRPLQGTDIPVCLSIIELPIKRSLMCSGVDFTGLLLLSNVEYEMINWHAMVSRDKYDSLAQSVTAGVTKALGRIYEQGVFYCDVALRNVLAHSITRRGSTFEVQLKLTDLERSRSRDGYRQNAK